MINESATNIEEEITNCVAYRSRENGSLYKQSSYITNTGNEVKLSNDINNIVNISVTKLSKNCVSKPIPDFSIPQVLSFPRGTYGIDPLDATTGYVDYKGSLHYIIFPSNFMCVDGGPIVKIYQYFYYFSVSSGIAKADTVHAILYANNMLVYKFQWQTYLYNYYIADVSNAWAQTVEYSGMKNTIYLFYLKNNILYFSTKNASSSYGGLGSNVISDYLDIVVPVQPTGVKEVLCGYYTSAILTEYDIHEINQSTYLFEKTYTFASPIKKGLLIDSSVDKNIFILLEDGSLYTKGTNRHGECGVTPGTVSDFTFIGYYSDVEVSFFTTNVGEYLRATTYAIDLDGKLYGWGFGGTSDAVNYYALPNGTDVSTPLLLLDKKVVKIAPLKIGYVSTFIYANVKDFCATGALFLAIDGSVYAIGNSYVHPIYGDSVLSGGYYTPVTTIRRIWTQEYMEDISSQANYIPGYTTMPKFLLVGKSGNVYTCGSTYMYAPGYSTYYMMRFNRVI